MRILARIAAILSFLFFLLAGAGMLLLGAEVGVREGPIIFILGLCLLGLAFFFGALLWLAGEWCHSKLAGR
jgi:hypothetical protein